MIKVATHCVERIEKTFEADRMDWWHQELNIQEAWKETKGKGIKIGIIDTGIDTKHPDLKDRIASTWSYDQSVEDENGHGTHVAGIIGASENQKGMIGIAPESSLYVAKAMNAKGQGSMDVLCEALEWCLNQQVDIINLSLGTSQIAPIYVHRMLYECINAGIWIVAAAGNQHEEVSWPALEAPVLAVGAMTKEKQVASFSNYGAALDLSMPGVSILSTYLQQRYARLSGTSMAAPMVSGILGLYKSIASDSFDVMYQKLTRSIIDAGSAGFDHQFGYGMIDIKKLFEK